MDLNVNHFDSRDLELSSPERSGHLQTGHLQLDYNAAGSPTNSSTSRAVIGNRAYLSNRVNNDFEICNRPVVDFRKQDNICAKIDELQKLPKAERQRRVDAEISFNNVLVHFHTEKLMRDNKLLQMSEIKNCYVEGEISKEEYERQMKQSTNAPSVLSLPMNENPQFLALPASTSSLSSSINQAGLGLGPASLDSNIMKRILDEVKTQMLSFNQSWGNSMAILNKEQLMMFLLEISSCNQNGLEEKMTNIKNYLSSSTSESNLNFTFLICVSFFQCQALIEEKMRTGHLTLGGCPTSIQLEKLNFDLRCGNNRDGDGEKEKDMDIISSSTPRTQTPRRANAISLLSNFENSLNQMVSNAESMCNTKPNIDESIERLSLLANEIKHTDNFKSWLKEKSKLDEDQKSKRTNKEVYNYVRYYKERLFGLVKFPEPQFLLDSERTSIIEILFSFIHYPIENIFALLHRNYLTEMSEQEYLYMDIKSKKERDILHQNFKKIAYGRSCGIKSVSEYSKHMQGFLASIPELREDIDNFHSDLQISKDNGYSMVKNDIYRTVYLTILVIILFKKFLGKYKEENGMLNITQFELKNIMARYEHHLEKNFYDLAEKSKIGELLSHLFSLLDSPTSNGNLPEYIHSHWNDLEGHPSCIHKTKAFKWEFLLVCLGSSTLF